MATEGSSEGMSPEGGGLPHTSFSTSASRPAGAPARLPVRRPEVEKLEMGKNMEEMEDKETLERRRLIMAGFAAILFFQVCYQRFFRRKKKGE
eukprot:CAMPEP_0182912376 /NCGR_PEP_ID=MMETSP0034_2-20130328/37485_1 /TAXON_ID=156128 /ORGANISM="Nephroselmis pyriformis, Strain CCMP717" /LENGTH=92 /DNA_ID=CAMNT_0025049045 /DNA_START=69 /DNA_END=347 /DNA_ORIENTATION=-